MSSSDGGCSAGQLVGAVLGTFFSTLALCVVIGTIVLVCYRRKLRAKYQDSAKKNVISPPSTNGDVAAQSYTNRGFRGPAAGYESHATLPIRQSATIDSMTCVDVEGTGMDVNGMSTARQGLPGQESLVRLQLSRQDKIGKSFNVKRTDSGRVFVSEILTMATGLLRSVMNPGDEILEVGVTIQPATTVDAVVNILLAAGASNCPVRLTLLRRRSTQTTNNYMSPVDPGGSGTAGLGELQRSSSGAGTHSAVIDDDSPIGFSSFSSEPSPPDEVGLTRWRSAELEVVGQPPAGETPQSVSGHVPADGLRIALDQHPNRSRIDANQPRSTSTTLPDPQQPDSDEQIYVNDRAVAGTSTTTAAAAIRPSSSSDELYANSNGTRRNDDLEDRTGRTSGTVEVGRSLDLTSSSGDGYSSFDTVEDYVNVANYIPSTRAPNSPPQLLPNATTSTTDPDVVTVDAIMTSSADDLRVSSSDDINESNDDDDAADYVNHPNVHLQALAARRARRDPRDVIKDPDLEGLEKALKAKERASRGGLAYYVDLEEHFTAFPGQKQQQQQAGSRGDEVAGFSSSTSASNSDVRSSRNDVTTSD